MTVLILAGGLLTKIYDDLQLFIMQKFDNYINVTYVFSLCWNNVPLFGRLHCTAKGNIVKT